MLAISLLNNNEEHCETVAGRINIDVHLADETFVAQAIQGQGRAVE